MNDRGITRYVFASSYTSQGFYSFIPQLVHGLHKVYILKGAPGSGKSTFIRMLGEVMSQQGYDVEFWVSSMDPITPDGVYIPQLDAAVINGSLPQPIDPSYPGVRESIINLGEYWDSAVVRQNCRAIIEQVDRIVNYRMETIKLLQEAAWVKEEIRKTNAARLNLKKIEALVQNLSIEIMEDRPGEKHYFAGVLTQDGLVDYVEEISASCKKRYIFKGPTGSGKSAVIRELVREARQRGYFIEYYHCGLEVDYPVMVVIRNLQLALIEAGHADIAAGQGDTVIDMAGCFDSYDAEEAAVKTSEAWRRYESLILQAQQGLANIGQSTREIKKMYTSAMDFERLDRKRQEIIAEINNR